MNIGIDIDGVLADFNSSYIMLLEELSGKPLRQPDDEWPDHWNYDAELVGPLIINEAWRHIHEEHFWLGLDPTEEYCETINELNRLHIDGHSIYFLTNRPGKWALVDTVEWLEENGANDPEVIIAKDAHDKAAHALKRKIDFFLDDKPENCLAVNEVCPNVYVLDRPWNRTWDNKTIKRIQHPLEMLTDIQEVATKYGFGI